MTDLDDVPPLVPIPEWVRVGAAIGGALAVIALALLNDALLIAWALNGLCALLALSGGTSLLLERQTIRSLGAAGKYRSEALLTEKGHIPAEGEWKSWVGRGFRRGRGFLWVAFFLTAITGIVFGVAGESISPRLTGLLMAPGVVLGLYGVLRTIYVAARSTRALR